MADRGRDAVDHRYRKFARERARQSGQRRAGQYDDFGAKSTIDADGYGLIIATLVLKFRFFRTICGRFEAILSI